MENISIDSTDRELIEALQNNAKARLSSIAKATGIPVTTIHNRIKRLEKEGIISGYTIRLNHKKLGTKLHALIFITANRVDQEELAKTLKRVHGVKNVQILTGNYDMLLDVRVADVDALNNFVIHELRTLNGIDKTHTMIVLSE